uniref:AMP-dependent synthetase/ligase domain-containing protein n=1 Tax=Chromera velia CCMP2878 TaxID=1169474 RepID=A0A0G4ID81_9ALVE|eukprot:Cvel_91.t1-p1 / transcript=Cvel_91.t1 / gene=Cvel_91 / organism=Chromera_velia_CCMP2878 / gene_product=Probable acyl-activating enzyme 17, peroxisomal, putative / transcript_product=Probable acyl-activating enzyme 17, peroxisomal, putative / location=Cvel_scaffold8:13435-15783(-) / protein_length=783 / sequence_SO=supercontig / SO=protein_coding / is_pseudo=false
MNKPPSFQAAMLQWQQLCEEAERGSQPNVASLAAHQRLFSQYSVQPYWIPTRSRIERTNLASFMRTWQDREWQAKRSGDPVNDLDLLYVFSVSEKMGDFWRGVFQQHDPIRNAFLAFPDQILNVPGKCTSPDEVCWFPSAKFNPALSCLGVHVDGKPFLSSEPALKWGSEGGGAECRSLCFEDFRALVLLTAQELRVRGIASHGSRVALILPLHPVAVVLYLAVVLLGGVVVSIPESFAASAIRQRLEVADVQAVVTQEFLEREGKRVGLRHKVQEAVRDFEERANRSVRFFSFAGDAGSLPLEPSHWLSLSPPVLSLSSSSDTKKEGKQPEDLKSLWTVSVERLENLHPDSRGAVVSELLRDVVVWRGGGDHVGLMFSSGTTSTPKAIPWGAATPFRCIADAWLHMDAHAGDVLAWPTSMGWMMGPWSVFAALGNGAALACFDGGSGGMKFRRFVKAAGVTILGVVPSLVRKWKADGGVGIGEWRQLRCFASTGEASNSSEYLWLSTSVPGCRPIFEYCGGTEIGGAYLTGTPLQAQVASQFSCPAFGTLPVILLGDGRSVPLGPARGLSRVLSGDDPGDWAEIGQQGEGEIEGELVLRPPSLGLSQSLLNKSHSKEYYDGMSSAPPTVPRGPLPPHLPLRRHGDTMVLHSGSKMMAARGRQDDAMNLGGIKVASVEIERCVTDSLPEVEEAAAVAVPPVGGGPEQLVVFVVLKPGHGGSTLAQVDQEALRQRANKSLSRLLNPLFRCQRLNVVPSLPRTASNKVMRRVLRDRLVKERTAKL